MTTQSIDQLCINTIRTLCDGRRPAGQLRPPRHADGPGPGRLQPLAALPALRPRRSRSGPNRDRFVLSIGHASMLLYSLLHLTGRQGRQPEVRDARRAVGHARRHQALPPARQQVPRPSRVPLDVRRRDHHRPARARASPPASAWPSPASGWPQHFNRPGFELFDFDVYALAGDGCMMEGISRRGRVAGRPPQARQPVLDLRQQPHHHRGPHRARLQRGRGHALPRLRLERHPRRRRQRPARCSTAPSRRSSRRPTGRR